MSAIKKLPYYYNGLLLVFCVVGLIYFRSILLPLAYALCFGVFVYPLYRWGRACRLPKSVNVASVSFVFLVASSLLLYLFAFSIQGWLDFFNSHGKELMGVQESFLAYLDRFNLKEYFIDQKITEHIMSILQFFSFSIVNYLSLFALSFVFYVFLFVAPEKHLEMVLDFKQTGALLRTYIKIKFFISFFTAMAVSLIFIAFDIKYWESVSILVFILNFIPNLGSIVATLLPLPMFYFSYDIGPEFWFLILSTSIVQFTLGNMIEPKIMGNFLNIPGIIVVFFLLVWGKVWGALGVFFAVPSLIFLSQINPKFKRLFA